MPAEPHQPDKMNTMHVVKRNGDSEEISFDKITKRIKSLCDDLRVDPTRVTQKVIENVKDGITTTELDEVSASVAAHMTLEHPDYADLAGRIAVSNLQKNTLPSFYKTMKQLYEATDINGNPHPIISKELWDITKKHRREIEDVIDYKRDFLYDYFGFQTLTRAYLYRDKGKILERIQHMCMRVALGVHGNDLAAAFESYELMSQKFFTHATPTLYNAGSPRPQLSSCYLLMCEDSIEGIFKNITSNAYISKGAGGIGISMHEIRCKGSPIYGTNGHSNGLVPLLRVLNSVSRYIDQCVSKDANILTTNGYQRAREIEVGSYLTGSDGKNHRVIRILEHDYDGDMMKIEMADSSSIECTPSQQLKIFRKIHQNSKAQRGDVIDYEAIDLIKGDMLLQPRKCNTEDVGIWSIDDCFILGLTAKISLKEEKEFSISKLDLPSEALNRIMTYFKETSILYRETDKEFSWQSQIAFPFTSKILKSGFPRAAFELPRSKQSEIIHASMYNPFADKDQVSELRKQAISEEFIEIKNLEKFHYAGKVYDFEIQTSQDYVSQIGVLHHAATDSR